MRLFLLTGTFIVLSACTLNGQPSSSGIDSLLVEADLLIYQGHYDSAALIGSEALEHSKAAEDSVLIGKSLFMIGLAHHYKVGGYRQALPYYEQAKGLLVKYLTEHDSVLIDFYNAYGAGLNDMGDRLAGREFFEKSLALRRKYIPEDTLHIAVGHYNLGLSSMYFGERKEALQHFLRALPSYRSRYGWNGPRVAQLYTNVGILYRDMGDNDHAIDYFQQGIEIHLHNHDSSYWNLAYPYFNLGQVYQNLGQYDLALEYLDKTYSLCLRNEGLRRLESITQSAYAQAYQKQKNYAMAKRHLNLAIDLLKEDHGPQHPRLSEYYELMGNLYAQQDEYEPALAWLSNAQEIVKLSYPDKHPQISQIYRGIAEVYEKQEEYHAALNQIQLGLMAIATNFENPSLDANPNTEDGILDENDFLLLVRKKASLFRALYDRDPENITYLRSSLDLLNRASEIIDFLRRGYSTESAKLDIQESAHKVYGMAIENAFLLYQHEDDIGYLDTIFRFMEKVKGTVLSESIRDEEISQVHGIPEDLPLREIQTRRHIKSLELQMAQASRDDSVYAGLRNKIFNAKLGRDSLMIHISEVYPNYYQLKYATNVLSLDGLKNSIGNHEIIITYYLGDSSWYMLATTSEKTVPYTIDVGISDEIQRFCTNASYSQSNFDTLMSTGQQISNGILAPVLDDFPEHKSIVVIPDGILSYLSFDALPIPGRPEFLLEEYDISYANSASLLFSNRREDRYSELYVGFAPSYPGDLAGTRSKLGALVGTQVEVRAAGKLFNGQTLLGAEATEKAFKELEADPVIIHLAMHGEVFDDEPLHSRLIFGNGISEAEDNALHAYEIYNMEIKSHLAVLSACHTGAGQIQRGEGVMSLSRAFLYAGCPNIVLSLWQARDQPTQIIMQTFFEKIHGGYPKRKALQEAKLAYLATADPLQRHPANWAFLVLWGEPGEVPFSAGVPWWWFAILLILLVGPVVYFSRGKWA